MKANENLMVGDWVKFKGSDLYHQVKVVSNKSIKFDNQKWFAKSSVEPIPLTPEVLEKNGFSLLRDAYGMGDPFWSYNSRNVLVDVTIIRTNNVKKIDWFNIKVSTRNGIKQVSIWGVKYIHEFQHALRLCGIEKEIVL